MRISVIIPFYNLERYVRPCLDSVVAAFRRAPTTDELEVVCVDDGSTDGTAALLDGYAPTFNPQPPTLNLKVVHKPNGGEGSARNAGMDVATGEWVTFLDGDDVWLENYLFVSLPLLRAYENADIVAMRYASFDDGSVLPASTNSEVRTCVMDAHTALVDEALLNIGVFPTFFRRSFLSGARFSDLPLGADRLFVAQCLARAEKIVMTESIVHGYRVRVGSMARAVWNARKVTSQCDYAFGSLLALIGSGKTLGSVGHAYLASIWLSDVPNRLLRLKASDRAEAIQHWVMTLDEPRIVAKLSRYNFVRRVVRRLASRHPTGAVRLAWIFRKIGLT